MHAGIKLLFGLVLVLLGLWLLVPAGGAFTIIKPGTELVSMFDWWSEFKTMLKGVIPPIVIILGLLIVWIESEELKSPAVPDIKVEKKEKPDQKKEKVEKKE